MAVVTPTIKGYPVVEANILKARHTGRIWSQYGLDKTAFAAKKAYNGMVLAIDDAAKSVKFPTKGGSATEVYALHMSSEGEYEAKGLNSFAVALEPVEGEPNVSVQYPRMYQLSVGDTLHTNCVELDGTNITAIDGDAATSVKSLLAKGTAVYGGVSDSGYIALNTTAATNGPSFQVVAVSTLPNGEWAVKLVVRKA